MKVALFSDSYLPDINGLAVSVGHLFETLKKHGDEVLLITSNSLNAKKSEYQPDLIRLKGIRFKKIYNYVISVSIEKKARKILKEFQPDICHIHTDGPIGQYGFRMSRKLHSKTVYTLHTSLEEYTHYVTGGWFLDKSAKKVVRKYLLKKESRSDAFIVPSQKVYEYLQSFMPSERIHIVPTGFDLSPFLENDERIVSSLSSSFGLNEDDFIILYLGRLAKEKAIEKLIQGFDVYLKDSKDEKAKFILFGDGPTKLSLMKLVKELGLSEKILFLGKVNPKEVAHYYKLGDVAVFSSLTETQGLTLLEALASGVPILTIRDQISENLIKDGENGFLFENLNDFSEALKKIRNLNTTKKKNIINNGYKVLEPYTSEAFYESVMKVYKETINGKDHH